MRLWKLIQKRTGRFFRFLFLSLAYLVDLGLLFSLPGLTELLKGQVTFPPPALIPVLVVESLLFLPLLPLFLAFFGAAYLVEYFSRSSWSDSAKGWALLAVLFLVIVAYTSIADSVGYLIDWHGTHLLVRVKEGVATIWATLRVLVFTIFFIGFAITTLRDRSVQAAVLAAVSAVAAVVSIAAVKVGPMLGPMIGLWRLILWVRNKLFGATLARRNLAQSYARGEQEGRTRAAADHGAGTLLNTERDLRDEADKVAEQHTDLKTPGVDRAYRRGWLAGYQEQVSELKDAQSTPSTTESPHQTV